LEQAQIGNSRRTRKKRTDRLLIEQKVKEKNKKLECIKLIVLYLF
jgi:hypothetical protein